VLIDIDSDAKARHMVDLIDSRNHGLMKIGGALDVSRDSPSGGKKMKSKAMAQT
jgi:hypothetical protein